jgi:uncharacterized protein (TIGR02118 family)
MINAVTLLTRRPDLSADEFRHHWRNDHAELIARLPGVQRYVQSHPLPESYKGEEPLYDGIAELWANDSQAFRDIGGSDAYAAVQADEETFLDRTAIALVLTNEHVIKDGPVAADGVKCIRLFKHRPDMPVEAFQSHWREDYGPQIATLPSLDRYVQYHARLGGHASGRQPTYDGFDVAWFGSIDALHDAMNSKAYDRARSDRSSFLAVDDCPQMLAKEHVIID